MNSKKQTGSTSVNKLDTGEEENSFVRAGK
jgi:hypothetical protein